MEDEEDEDDEVIEEDKSDDASSLSEEEVKSPKKQINGEKATSRKNQPNTIQQEVTRSGKRSNKGAGFKFRLGKQEVIKGWDVGVVGMKVGGRRRIICPPAMAYGQKGSPPAIPPNSSLVFEVELKNVV
ncbi:hypothetical protein RN001_006982 [Aquatica leii]|uniref:peptidylprolyl isomerase n=1 Tax=Aquatica leii TaxID=1421715 RepID=A0AAN7SQE2_9COLE|nr:hypothetical protein RN001_006982 [Aquatica leii]